MNLAALRTFLTIVETGNLNRAAERLHVTQSTVTARLKGLEDELGQVLFLRRKSGAELTSAGFKFQRYAQLMTDLWRQARQETSLPPEVEAICNIGCHFDLWPCVGRRLFESIRSRHPDVALSAWPGEQTDIDRWLVSGLVDAALCFSPSLRESRSVFKLRADRLFLVTTQAPGRQAWQARYLYVDFGEEFRLSHAAAYPDSATPNLVFGCAVWALEHMLAHGGAAYMPERLAAPHLANGTLHLVQGTPEFQRAVYLVANNRAAAQWPWLPARLKSLQDDVG